MPISAGKLWGYKRLSDEKGFFKMVATDQRPPIMNVIKKNKNVAEASYDDVAEVKKVFAKILSPNASATLMEPLWTYQHIVKDIDPKKGLILTLEEHKFIENEKGRLSSEIADWSVAKIKSIGADAVKVLTWYRPDADPSICEKQQEWTAKIGAACKKYDILFLLEMLVYPLPHEANKTKEYEEDKDKYPEHVINSLKVFADKKYYVDVFKLESPIPASQVPELGSAESLRCQKFFNDLNLYSPVPWVMLSAGASFNDFYKIMQYAYKAGASGYLAGRAIWWDAFSKYYPDMQKVTESLQTESVGYMEKLNALTDASAMPWLEHKLVKGQKLLEFGDKDFAKNYKCHF